MVGTRWAPGRRRCGQVLAVLALVLLPHGESAPFECVSEFAKSRDGTTYSFALGEKGQSLAAEAGYYQVQSKSVGNVTVLFQLCKTMDWSKVMKFATNCPNMRPSTQAVAIHSDGSCDVIGRDDTTKLELHVDQEDSVDGVVVSMLGLPRAGTLDDCSLDTTLVCGDARKEPMVLTGSKEACKYSVAMRSEAACRKTAKSSTKHSKGSERKAEKEKGRTGVALGATALVVAMFALGLSVFTAWKSNTFDTSQLYPPQRRGVSMLEDVLLQD